jgi:hypothetical protein
MRLGIHNSSVGRALPSLAGGLKEIARSPPGNAVDRVAEISDPLRTGSFPGVGYFTDRLIR